MITTLVHTATDHHRRQPAGQHRDLPGVRRRHDGHRHPRLEVEHDGHRLLHRRSLLHRRPERHRHRRGLPVGRELPGHHRRHRAHRLRRLPLLRRLPGGLAGRTAARRRAAAQHRQVHDGRRARVPDAPAPGAHRGRDLHAGRVVLLPPGPDGRCRRPRQPPAGHHRQRRPVDHDRRRRHPDDRLRAGRRDEGHHLGPDHQGRPADRRCRPDDVLGAEQVRVLPVERDGRRRRQQPAGRQAARARCQVRQEHADEGRLHLAVHGPGPGHRGPAARADALLHGAHVEGRPQVRGLGDLPDRDVLPVQPGPGLRRGRPRSAPRPSPRLPARPTRQHRCWPTSSAAPSCWASSPRWPSPRSSRWSPG